MAEERLYTEDLKKIFDLMKEYQIEYFKEGDLEIKRESVKLDSQAKSHEREMKQLVNQVTGK